MDLLDDAEYTYMVADGKGVRCSLTGKTCGTGRNCLKCTMPPIHANRELAAAMREHSAALRGARSQ